MQSAGFTETRSHPPIQNLAKASKHRCQAENPHFVYSLLPAGIFYQYPNILRNSFLFDSNCLSIRFSIDFDHFAIDSLLPVTIFLVR